MNTNKPFDIRTRNKAILAFSILIALTIAAVVTACLTQRGFGRIEASNVRYLNYNNIPIRAKLLCQVGMTSERTRKVIDHPNPQFGVTYGNFADGTTRRVFMPRTTHVKESFSREAIAEALEWMRQALKPDTKYWIWPNKQIWPIKEWACFIAMLACFASIMPLGLILLGTKFFNPLQAAGMKRRYICSPKNYFKFAGINGVLMLFYLPIILILFGFHIYVIRIDKAFPAADY